MPHAVVYARVSTARQAENDLSIPDQLAHAQTYCAARNITIAATYCDRGASAMDDNRPEFQAMIEDLREGRVAADLVLVHSFSRFFRDLLGSLTYRRQLAKLGVNVLSMTQEVSADAGMAETFLQLQAMMDESASRENAKHVKRCMLANAQRGYWNGAPAPFGYRIAFKERIGAKDKKVLEIEPLEAETVRLAFQLYVYGDGASGPMGVKLVTARLNALGKRTRSGRPFLVQFVGKMLRSETYVGRHYFNRSNSRTRERRPQEDWVMLSVPPVVDAAVFQAAQDRLDLNNPIKTAPRTVNSPVLLTGLARCGQCDGPLKLRTGKGGRYRYYACARRLDSGAARCRGAIMPEAALDGAVINALIERVLAPERLKPLLAALAARGCERHETLRGELKGLRDRAANVRAKLKNLFGLAAEGVRVDAVMKAEIVRLQTEAEDLARLARAKESELATPIGPISDNRVAQVGDALATRLKDTAQPQLARAYLRLIVSDIAVSEREIRISGRKDSLLRCASGPDLPPPPVPSFAQEWRTRQDSNL